MTNENQQGRVPDWKGDGIAIWFNEKNGKTIGCVKVVGHNPMYVFKNEPKEEKVEL